jgi:hypothetical protein
LSSAELLDVVSFKNEFYCRLKKQKSMMAPDLNVDGEIGKYKKLIHDQESLLRQVKLMQTIRQSGEETTLLDLIDKWKDTTRQVIRELFSHSSTGGSFRGFVKRLGLQWDELEFSDNEEDECESENEFENENENDENNQFYSENYNSSNTNNNDNCDTSSEQDYKRIKYEEW